MVKAMWNGEVIAESDDTIVVEGNHYFPATSVHRGYLQPSSRNTTCPWKGTASYYTLAVNGKTNKDAAWFYQTPKPAAQSIAGRVAFWRGVSISLTDAAEPGGCVDCEPNQATSSKETDLGRAIAYGALGGLVAGMVFGMMMSMLGMIQTVAMLVGSEALIVGWGLHLAISVFIGATFGAIARSRLANWGAGIAVGVSYGVFWWILGALILMPAKLGMPVFEFNTVAWQSLMGHMVFGLVMAVVTVALVRQSSQKRMLLLA